MPTLLEYLTRPNLEVDRSGLREGSNSLPVGDYEVEGVQDWVDFTYETVIHCFGDILNAPIDSGRLVEPAPFPAHYLQLTDEATVQFVLSKHNHTIVDCALRIAQEMMPDRGFNFPVSWAPGSYAHTQEDTRLRPDWCIAVTSGHSPFTDRCPGDTKQSRKWNTAMLYSTNRHIREEFEKPLRQGHLYCVRNRCRSCFLISDKELVWLRRVKSPEPAEAVSTNRPRRQPAQSHQPRVLSITSATTSMSLDSSGSPYTDAGNPDIEEQHLQMRAVPWSAHGPNQLTVNLALWAGALWAALDNSVQESYPNLSYWEKIPGPVNVYRQVGSLRQINSLPAGATLVG